MVKRDLIRNIIIAVLAIVVILLLRAFVFSTHRVTEGQANDYIHAGDYVTFNKNVEPQKKDFILYTVNGKEYIGRVIADEGKSVTAMDDFLYVMISQLTKPILVRGNQLIWRQFHLGISSLMIFPLQH